MIIELELEIPEDKVFNDGFAIVYVYFKDGEICDCEAMGYSEDDREVD